MAAEIIQQKIIQNMVLGTLDVHIGTEKKLNSYFTPWTAINPTPITKLNFTKAKIIFKNL